MGRTYLFFTQVRPDVSSVSGIDRANSFKTSVVLKFIRILQNLITAKSCSLNAQFSSSSLGEVLRGMLQYQTVHRLINTVLHFIAAQMAA